MDSTCGIQYSDLALGFLKADLGYFDSEIPGAIESNLIDLLCVAGQNLLEECRIPLDPDNVCDAQLQSMYAAWLYRSRASGASKPPMLKDAIRNRQLRNATRDAEVVL